MGTNKQLKPATIHPIRTEAQAQELAHHLLDPERTDPVVVITTAQGQTEPYCDVALVAAEVAGLAEIWQLPTGDLSWAFSAVMPELTQVYGGASRMYQRGQEWVENPRLSPLRFAFTFADGKRVARALVEDVMRCSEVWSPTPAPAKTAKKVHAEVLGVVAGVGMAKLANRGHAKLRLGPVLEALGAERVLKGGMKVEGLLLPSGDELDISDQILPAGEALEAYHPGDVVLAKVCEPQDEQALAELYPGFKVCVEVDDELSRAIGRPVSVHLEPGVVIRLFIEDMGEQQGDWLLSTLITADAETKPAPSVLQGGPPWLEKPVAPVELPAPEPPALIEPEAPVSAEVVAAPVARSAAAGPTPATLPNKAERTEVARLTQMLASQNEQMLTARRDLASAKAQLRTAARQLEETTNDLLTCRTANKRAENDDSLFLDPVEQLQFEVQLAWARRIQPSEKASLPPSRWKIGPKFLETVAEVQGLERSKLVDVIVEVLTGLVWKLDGRDAHQLRTGAGGDDPVMKRADGAVCWRIAIQQGTPSARRLHFWVLNDGSIELSSVRLHDDMRV